MPFKRLLIANRGEIAVRIIRACREMGIESVAVYSDADADALHVRLADASVHIGSAPASNSYLSVPALMAAAAHRHVDAIHPGYGFLSERAELARACEQAGVVFVGPPADVIERMGSKIAARALMEAAGVPIVPGRTPPDQSDEGVLSAAREIGFPVLVKASAGGGGKGMRVLSSDGDKAHVSAARREALAAFGDGTLYVERLITRPRHVEIQILADRRGRVIHLFERECSLQRRHQKIVEETPSPAITPTVRQRMGHAAVAAATAAGYHNAGTIEFLVEGEGDAATFYFLEMNTRLQVEHPITEAVTGIDLVRAQLAVAAGEPLPWTQEAVAQRGHAVECRIYAEDPRQGFLPQAGPLLVYREPAGPGIRVDSGVVEGDSVSVHYDPLLAKLIASGETREAALARAIAALETFPILGIHTNVEFLLTLLRHPDVRAGRVHTGLVDERLDELTATDDAPLEAWAAAGTARPAGQPPLSGVASAHQHDPWSTIEGWGRGTRTGEPR